MMTDRVSTEGLQLVGELQSRVLREAVAEPQFDNARVAGAIAALNSVAEHVKELLLLLGPYDDRRMLDEILVWIADRIRETAEKQSG